MKRTNRTLTLQFAERVAASISPLSEPGRSRQGDNCASGIPAPSLDEDSDDTPFGQRSTRARAACQQFPRREPENAK